MREFSAQLRLSHAWDVSFLTIDPGISLGASLQRQTFATSRSAPDKDALSPFGSVDLGISIQHPWGLVTFAEAAALGYLLPVNNQTTPPHAELLFSGAFRLAAGLTKLW